MNKFKKGEIVSFIEQYALEDPKMIGRIVEDEEADRYLLRLDDERITKRGHKGKTGVHGPYPTADYWFVDDSNASLTKIDIDKIEVSKEGADLILRYAKEGQVIMTEKVNGDSVENLRNTFKTEKVKPHLLTDDGDNDGWIGGSTGHLDVFNRLIRVGDVVNVMFPDRGVQEKFMGYSMMELLDVTPEDRKILIVKKYDDLEDGERHGNVKAVLK